MRRKVVTYIRVSTEEQAKHGYSIEAQRQILKDYASGHQLEIVREFVESQSAYKPGRPEFDAMLRFLKQHTGIGGVLCYKIDRIARNLQDYSALTEMMGTAIISATEQLPENATGQLMGGVQAVFARYYSAQLSERVSLGLATKARKGYWPTYAPTGYCNEGKGIVPDPERAPLIAELFEQFARSDMSVDGATQWARERGLRSRYGCTLARSAIHKLLTNPIYYGALPWKGQLFRGKHEPVISKALFDRVQERLHGRALGKTKRSFPYRGLLTCGYCGCGITAEIKKGKYVYYRCTYGRGECEQPYRREEQLSRELWSVVDGIHLSTDLVERIVGMFKEREEELERFRRARSLELKAEESRVLELRDSAYLDKLEGTVDEERWLSMDRRLSGQLDHVRDEKARLAVPVTTSVDNVREALELLERAPDLYLRESHEERAKLLRTVVSNCRLTAENVVPVYREPFDAVAEGLRSGNWLGEEDSNPH